MGVVAPAGKWLRSDAGSEEAWRDGMVTGTVAQVAQLQVDIGLKRGRCDVRDTEIRVLRVHKTRVHPRYPWAENPHNQGKSKQVGF